MFFFFKQKTAYEMRISDWSSDVCSSDLPVRAGSAWSFSYRLHWLAEEPYPLSTGHVIATRIGRGGIPGQPRPEGKKKRSEERRVGKEGVRTCRSGWWPDP